MLLKRIDRFWKSGLVEIRGMFRGSLYVAFIFILFGATGCSNAYQTEIQTEEEENEVLDLEQNNNEEAERIAETYCDIYEDGLEAKALGSLETMRSIVRRLGENGYVAVDSENQIDMTQSEQVIEFCKQVDVHEEAELIIIVVSYSDGYTKYDLKTEGGNVDIVQEYYQYKDGKLEKTSIGSSRADTWQYTEEGYLIFSGSWFLEEYYILSLSVEEEHIALRVESLDEKCRDFNRQYIHPIGYGQNNMFLYNWSENDFGELNFYDMYDIFYPIMNNQFVPYFADDNLGVGAIYRIPKAEFENVIMEYFKIDSEILRLKTTYFSEDATYEYKPRGFYEVEYPKIPYPEVVSYIENSDGTITLTVNAVYPNGNTSKLYVHEVVIRKLDNGHFHYVSNRIITPADDQGLRWYTPRLTEEEWEEMYGGYE